MLLDYMQHVGAVALRPQMPAHQIPESRSLFCGRLGSAIVVQMEEKPFLVEGMGGSGVGSDEMKPTQCLEPV